MSTVKKGGFNEVGAPAGDRPAVGPSRIGEELLRSKNAFEADEKRRTPKSEYMYPHRTKVAEEVRIANARHHLAEVEEEARRHHLRTDAAGGMVSAAEDLLGDDEESELAHLGDDETRRERRRRGHRGHDDDDAPFDEDAEEIVAAAQAAAERGLVAADAIGKFYRDLPADRLGDPTLTQPDDIRRALGPSVRFAQHAMLLAEARLKAGASRNEALAYLAELYVGVSDRAYANKALREFGPGTGILDLYPLEVIDRLLENVPQFFTKLARGPFLSPAPDAAYEVPAGRPLILRHDPELRIRGFALKGGPRPGYVFEPIDPPGTYQLIFHTPGRYTALVSAMSKDGVIRVEEFDIQVGPREGEVEESKTLARERAHQAELAKKGSDGAKKKNDLTIYFPRKI